MDKQILNSKTALLLVDMQNDFCHPEGTANKRGKNVQALQSIFENIAHLLDVARKQQIPILHVISDHSEWTKSPSEKERYGRTRQEEQLSYCEPNTWGADIYAPFQPKMNERIVVKHRYSGFLHTDLELILRANSIGHVVITGAYTNVCIDCTARDAYMRDFTVTIPSDCVASDNEKLHYYTLELLKGTFAHVCHSHDIKKWWEYESE